MTRSPSAPKTFYLIDGHAQIFRAYHAIRSLSSPVTGEATNATFGFVGMLLKLFKQYRPDYIAMAIDRSGDRGTFRSQLDEQYKANRSSPPDDFHPQVDRIVELSRMMNIPVLWAEGYEADDVIATLCHRLAERSDIHVRIVSKDKDLAQLLDDHVAMFDIHTDELIDVEKFKLDKGVEPSQVIDMLALMGDTSDNIPGVKGIGPKTAAQLISAYGSIDQILAHLDDLKPKQRDSIAEAQSRLQLNQQLVRLRDDVPLDFDLDQAAVQTINYASLDAAFRQLGFNRHMKDLQSVAQALGCLDAAAPNAPASAAATPPSTDDFADGLFSQSAAEAPALSPLPAAASLTSADPSLYRAVTTKQQLDDLVTLLKEHAARGKPIAVDTETTSLRIMQAQLCGISIAWEPRTGVYIPIRSPQPDTHLDEQTVLDALRPILENSAIRKVGQNIKYDLNILRHAGIRLTGIYFDTMIASYLIDSARTSHKLDNLALACLDYQMVPLTDLIGSGSKQITFDQVPLDRAVTYAAEDADITLRLLEVFVPKLRIMGLEKLFDELEMPLIDVLAELEYNGIAVDETEFDRQRQGMAQRITDLRNRIIDTAHSDFNPDSPRQLADVLFNQLSCKVVKRRKTGPSTDSEVLQRISEEQAGPGALVAELVLEYRQLTKLMGTYLESLKQAVDPSTRRIHASFNQTGAATGRLSSSDPNLQNIPIRTEEGRLIRKAFIAPPDHLLLSADYSQIELRLLAHLSADPNLITAFEQDLDIHTAVASEVFSIPLDQVTPDQRNTAKMVNFGIIYGITPYGLARRLARATSAAEDVDAAKRIIADYKKRYPKIDAFLERCVDQAATKGYVETMLKRRRLVPQVQSSNANLVALGRRIAINTVVQGSAADLIKIAMVRLHRRIHSENLPMKMLLQIHDELVFEMPRAAIDAQAAIVQQEMSAAMDLAVPLKVELAFGENWMQSK